MADTHTLSMASGDYDWDDFDTDAHRMGFNRSQFLQHIYEQWKKQRRLTRLRDNITNILLLLILGFATCTVMLLVSW